MLTSADVGNPHKIYYFVLLPISREKIGPFKKPSIG
jgi:hypothetical protein